MALRWFSFWYICGCSRWWENSNKVKKKENTSATGIQKVHNFRDMAPMHDRSENTCKYEWNFVEKKVFWGFRELFSIYSILKRFWVHKNHSQPFTWARLRLRINWRSEKTIIGTLTGLHCFIADSHYCSIYIQSLIFIFSHFKTILLDL